MTAPAVTLLLTVPKVDCPCCGRALVDDGRVIFDPDGGFVVAGEQFASLTEKESLLFMALWSVRPKTLGQETLLERLYWQRSIDEEPEIKIIDVFICKLRQKLAGMPVKIETCWGRGYRINLIKGSLNV